MTVLPFHAAAGSATPQPTPLGPDPVGAMSFIVDAPGLNIGRFSECNGLAIEYQVLEYQEGGQNAFTHKLRGPLKHRNLVLKRGITSDDGLLQWFQLTQQLDKRPSITVTLMGPGNQRIRSWVFERAFPVRWTGPVLNAGAGSLASEELEIAHRGFAAKRPA